MDKIILGLLVLKNMTIYDIKGFIATYLSGSYADSLGSIQYALKKLLEAEAVVYESYVDNGHHKKVYSITKKGLSMFNAWLKQPVDLSKSKNMQESKLFFIGIAEKQVRINMLKGYIEALQQEKEKLKAIERLVSGKKTDPIQQSVMRFKADDEAREKLFSISQDRDLTDLVTGIYTYQMATLRYSLMEVDMQMAFYQDLLNKEV